MDHAKLIAVRMEEARDARGISVAELARRASIDRKRLWYILDGQRQMRADEFVRLCAVMGLDWQPFLGHFSQRLRPAFRNSTGLMYPSVECIRSLLYHHT